jgi:hypothetical protein
VLSLAYNAVEKRHGKKMRIFDDEEAADAEIHKMRGTVKKLSNQNPKPFVCKSLTESYGDL